MQPSSRSSSSATPLSAARGESIWATFSTTALQSTGSSAAGTPLSMRVRVSSFSEIRVSRSASSPMSETKSRTVSMSMVSVWRMESVSRRMEARGVTLR